MHKINKAVTTTYCKLYVSPIHFTGHKLSISNKIITFVDFFIIRFKINSNPLNHARVLSRRGCQNFIGILPSHNCSSISVLGSRSYVVGVFVQCRKEEGLAAHR